jgi:hypothetical protein
VLLFMLVTKLLMLVLKGPSLLIGDQFKGLAQTCADNPILYNSLCSNTGYLGRTILGVCFAPLFAILMYRLVVWARTYLMPKMLAQRKLVPCGSKHHAGLVGYVVCWRHAPCLGRASMTGLTRPRRDLQHHWMGAR